MKDMMRYDLIVEEALRGAVRRVLEEVAKDGLPGEHHFYITFDTQYVGVELPDFLKERYPEEMTIILQYQFYGLEVDEEKFQVTLSFNNVPERLVIPLDAITVFADPSVNFALQFEHGIDGEDIEEGEEVDDEPGEQPSAANLAFPQDPEAAKKALEKPEGEAEDAEKASEKKGEVVSLDQFRKK
jgi:hypothetical protein